jgi:outer membrane protein assembly factor BamB
VQVAGASDQTRKRFAELEERLQRTPDAEAVDEVLRWIEENGDVLIRVDPYRYVPAGYWGQVLLSRLSPQQLQTYRLRVDPLAEQMLSRARQRGDLQGLRQLIERYGLSRPAAQALLFYGDALLERGEVTAAWELWEHLHPEGHAEWIHPDVREGNDKDLAAQAAARRVLALWLREDPALAYQHWERLQQQFPQARGRLAGQEGVFHQVLAELLRHPPRYARPRNAGRSWSTFASRPSRNPWLALPYRPGETHPSWRRELSLVPRLPAEGEWSGFRQPWPHPVAAEGRIFLTDGFRLYAFDALNGQPLATLELLTPPREAGWAGSLPCPTLTLEGNGLFLRTGLPLLRPMGVRDDHTSAGELVYVQIERHEKNTVTLRKQWHLSPPFPKAFWEGSPLVVGRKLWAAYGRFEGGRLHQGVVCYDPADAATEPTLRWHTEVSISPWLPLPMGRTRLELLTWADGRIIFNTNSGVVMALDASTGRRLWAWRYPRGQRSVSNDTPAQPAPAIYEDGRVFVAPLDSDGIFVLDVHDGHLLWQLRGLEGVMLHAVTAHHLFATVRRPLPAILAINLQTGSPRRSEGGWFVPLRDTTWEATFGLVTKRNFLYPARAGMLVFHHEDGTPGYDPASDQWPPANYLMVDGILIAVTPQHLLGCVPERLRFGAVPPFSPP